MSTAQTSRVSMIDKDTVMLDVGSKSGVKLDHVWELFPSFHLLQQRLDSSATVKGPVSAVFDSKCVLRKKDMLGDVSAVNDGWVARSCHSPEVIVVTFEIVKNASPSVIRAGEALMELISESSDLTSFHFNFPDCWPYRHADFYVVLQDVAVLHLYDRQRGKLASISADGQSPQFQLNIVCQVFRHAHFARSFASLKSPQRSKKPRYDFRMQILGIQRKQSSSDDTVNRQVVLKNLEKRTVHIAVFRLSASHGVHQVVPQNGRQSRAVEPGKQICEMITMIDNTTCKVEQPKSLKEGNVPNFLKMFLSFRSFDLEPFLQSDLDTAAIESGMMRRRIMPQAFAVYEWSDQIEVRTTAQKRPVEITLDAA